MVFGAPAPAPDVRVAFIPVTDQQVHKLAEGLRTKLVEPPPDVSPKLAARIRPGDVLSLPLPVALSEKAENGQALVAADLTLAPLAPGDYAIELVVGQGANSERRYVAFRVGG